MPNVKIIFFGTSEFGSVVLGKLVQAGYKPVLVVTTPDKPAGRNLKLISPPVKILAEQYSLPVAQPEKLGLAKFDLQNLAKPSLEPDLFVVASYGEILPREVLDIPKKGTLNVHPSLLPQYRGPSPVHTAILNGDRNTGVTIMLLDEKMDHGPILAQQEFPISNETFPLLRDKLAELGADLLMKTIPAWVAGSIKAVVQDDSKATYTKIFAKEDGKIDWNKSAEEVERQIRAFTPWPGTFTSFKVENQKSNLKILRASVLPQNLAKPSYPQIGLAKFAPGAVFLTPEGKLGIQCGEDALVIEELQLEGKKPMSSKEFLLGHKTIIDSIC